MFIGPRGQTCCVPGFATTRWPTCSARGRRWLRSARRSERHACRRSNRLKIADAGLGRRRQPGECYTYRSYGAAVRRACTRAGVRPWHPHQIRHTRGTEVRKQYKLEGAQVALGHSHAKITETYAERDHDLALKIAQETG